jgi:hypothetical protein
VPSPRPSISAVSTFSIRVQKSERNVPARYSLEHSQPMRQVLQHFGGFRVNHPLAQYSGGTGATWIWCLRQQTTHPIPVPPFRYSHVSSKSNSGPVRHPPQVITTTCYGCPFSVYFPYPEHYGAQGSMDSPVLHPARTYWRLPRSVNPYQ